MSIIPRAIKGQAITKLLARFFGEDISKITNEMLKEVAKVVCLEMNRCLWEMTFDRSSISTSGGAGIILAKEENEALSMSYKLDFLCSYNLGEYEAYLTGLRIA